MGSIGEKHLSRLAAPKHWPIRRHGLKWITRLRPGAHSLKTGMPLNVILRDLLGYAGNNKEVKTILNNQDVLVDGKRRKEPRFNTGVMDVLSLPRISEYYRIMFDKKGKIALLPIKEGESRTKVCKIIGKRLIKGKLQINLSDGKNLLVEKGDYKKGDSVLIEVPVLKVKEVLAMAKGNLVYMTAGKHVGEIGQVREIKGERIVVKTKESEFETLRRYGLVIGKDKPVISLIKE
jgi:small subunit ribosomal protein S4e